MSESPRTTPRKRGEGQWALGYHEPLNPAERVKKDDDGLHVRARIETKYSKQGFRSIDKADLRSRFRWWGLYTQRKQGLPGGVTATAEPHELEDEYFMLRIRIPGGQLSSDQLRAVAHCSEYYGRDVADVTDRQNIQLHWIRIEDVPAIWEALEAVGLSTQEACGDTPRVMIGCPLAGVDAGEIIDATPALLETERRYVGDPAFSNLPRKFKTSMSGCRQQCAQHEVNDVAFVGVLHPELGAGFDLWVGGGLSTNPHIGQRVGVFVEPGLVPEVWAGVIGLFRDYGYRRARNHARLKFLVADKGRRGSARSSRVSTSAARSPTATRRLRRSTRTATTSGSSRRRTAAATWASRRRPGGSRATSSGRSPTWPIASGKDAPGPRRSRRW